MRLPGIGRSVSALFRRGPCTLVAHSVVCLALGAAVTPAFAGAPGPLEQIATIPMPGVKGRIDHFSADVAHHRLFVAALGNDAVEVIDVAANRHEKSLPGFGEPQGLLYLPESGRLFVANGSANRVDVLQGKSLAPFKRVAGLADADNLRFDAVARRVIVGYGGGALRVIDPESAVSIADVRLAGHPESFQLEQRGTRIFVNVPEARQIAVVDRAQARVVATWDVPGARANFPMALDETEGRLFVGARAPALMLVYDIDSGQIVARLPIGGDSDDVFFDRDRKRVYVICGAGEVIVFRQESADRYAREATVSSAPRARTGLFVPEDRKLYVAAPASGGHPARLLVYRIR